MRCKHRVWERVEGVRHRCRDCGAIGFRRHWAGKNKRIVRYKCPCGRTAVRAVWRGTHQMFLCIRCLAPEQQGAEPEAAGA